MGAVVVAQAVLDVDDGEDETPNEEEDRRADGGAKATKSHKFPRR